MDSHVLLGCYHQLKHRLVAIGGESLSKRHLLVTELKRDGVYYTNCKRTPSLIDGSGTSDLEHTRMQGGEELVTTCLLCQQVVIDSARREHVAEKHTIVTLKCPIVGCDHEATAPYNVVLRSIGSHKVLVA